VTRRPTGNALATLLREIEDQTAEEPEHIPDEEGDDATGSEEEDPRFRALRSLAREAQTNFGAQLFGAQLVFVPVLPPGQRRPFA
jgi:hypothetical protein